MSSSIYWETEICQGKKSHKTLKVLKNRKAIEILKYEKAMLLHAQNCSNVSCSGRKSESSLLVFGNSLNKLSQPPQRQKHS